MELVAVNCAKRLYVHQRSNYVQARRRCMPRPRPVVNAAQNYARLVSKASPFLFHVDSRHTDKEQEEEEAACVPVDNGVVSVCRWSQAYRSNGRRGKLLYSEQGTGSACCVYIVLSSYV